MKTVKLLVAEVLYNRSVLIFLSVATLLNILVLNNWWWLSGEQPEQSDFGFLIIGYLLFVFLFTFIISPGWKELRTRQLLILPVSSVQIAITEILRFVIYLFFLYLLFYLITVSLNGFMQRRMPLTVFLSVSGISFTALSLILIARESSSYLNGGRLFRIKGMIVRILLYLFTGFLVLVWFAASIENYQTPYSREPQEFLQVIYLHPAATLILFLAGVLMLYLRVIFFKHRKSYI